ncbi:histidine phosphatase family protein [Bradyrhizobium sp. AUGA SZCCT0177]|uniref:SixA phosphatase family protein n=1 Tax=Bradyrhizobium sp. AUGA SZCCT0177 TaxID=2807665 RepID=UPI001BAE49BB|nr:histidine phosphatase family protein [Bradyrhizobium sp. AUGA SZCCT0177]MBR1282627.1 histidine phosphatase family protein [Bradyrhizobium sp. AUGA SZCCT0177]
MRRLMLLRHAKTEHDAPSGQDQDRRLDDRGRLDAAAIGGWIGRHLPLPDMVLISTAVRTQQTWEIVREAMQDAAKDFAPPQAEFLAELYGADPTHLLQIIRMAEATDPKRLMVIGHNPGMHELALALSGSGDAAAKKALNDNLPTSGLAILDFAIEDWNEVAFRRGNLVRFTSPKLLRQTSDD